MMSFYELAVAMLGTLPPQMEFLYSIMSFVLTLMTVSTCLAFILLPLVLIRK